ncbi:hypothetical protein QCA50_016513 [Cerrena zonata]|uniref:Uncharacterized protein n=1 Tax=Cerrena zonata TaxID=2478898 RepID=A0AAW0FFM5_9APHY
MAAKHTKKAFRDAFSARDESSDSAGDFSDSETERVIPQAKSNPKAEPISDDEDDFQDDEESDDGDFYKAKKKPSGLDKFQDEEEEEEDEEEEEEEIPNEEMKDPTSASGMVAKEAKRNRRLKKLTPEQLEKEQKKIKKTGHSSHFVTVYRYGYGNLPRYFAGLLEE